jgi:histidyl-tRNA synthetase
VGSDSLLNEVDLMQITDDIFTSFGVRVQIKINNRKILTGIAEVIGEADKIVDITVAIDKLDKIGLEAVNDELRTDGISEEAIAKLQPIIKLEGTNAQKLDTIANVLSESEIGMKGVEEMRYILDHLGALNTNGIDTLPEREGWGSAMVQLDLTLARGLNYYTGAIFEVKALDVQIGSITGGGRYDNLTGIFGMPGLSGVGISFGADRIYDVLNQLDLYPKETVNATKILFVCFGDAEIAYSMPLVKEVRNAGIPAEIYPTPAKMKKQLGYADSKNIKYVAIVGSDEMEQKKVTLKNMETGEQEMLAVSEVIERIK